MKKLMVVLAMVTVLIGAVPLTSAMASDAVGVLGEDRFVVVSQSGKFVTLYEVRGDKLHILDAVVNTLVGDRIVIDPRELKPIRTQKRRD